MDIDKKSPIPVYYQLKNMIQKKILRGEFPEGSMIPSERELGEGLGISRMTVRQALNQLVQEGLLYREKGKGTFVAKRKIEQRNIMSFSESVRSRGLEPSTQIMYFNSGVDNQRVNEILGLNVEDRLYNFKRLRLADNVPIAVEEVFMPEKYFRGFENYDLTTSLYSLIREEYNYTISHIDNTIHAAKAANEERSLLKLSSNIPVLRISGISYSNSGLKLFYENDTYRSDEYSYNIRIFMSSDME